MEHDQSAKKEVDKEGFLPTADETVDLDGGTIDSVPNLAEPSQGRQLRPRKT